MAWFFIPFYEFTPHVFHFEFIWTDNFRQASLPVALLFAVNRFLSLQLSQPFHFFILYLTLPFC